MPRFNIIYFLLFLGVVFFLPVTKFITSHPQEFFGIAENQIRSINLEYPVESGRGAKNRGRATTCQISPN